MPSAFRADLFMETISALISFSVAYFAMKAYKLTQSKSLMHLYFGFSVLGAGMITRVIASSYIALLLKDFDPRVRALIFTISIIYGLMRTIAYILFTLAYVERARSKVEGELATAVIPPIIMNPYFEFIQMTLLIYVAAQSAMNFIESRGLNSLLIFAGFTLLLISHITFMFSVMIHQMYIIGHFIQLIGFFCMLLMLIRVGRGK